MRFFKEKWTKLSGTPSNTNDNNSSTNNASNNTTSNEGSDGYGSRFIIALALIVGMLIILTISVLESQFTQTEQLAAIFSGWITSIVAFYFYGQSTAAAQNQIKTATQSALNSEHRAIQAENKISNIKSMVSVHSAIKNASSEKSIAPSVTDEVIRNINDILQKD